MKYTKETLAALIDGREIGSEVSHLNAKEVKTSGLLIVYGYSDDLIEFAGLFSDEFGAYNAKGKEIKFDREGIIQEWEEFINDCVTIETAKAQIAKLENAKMVRAYWCRQKDGPSWSFETDLPHAKFKIMEDGDVFCEGLVIDMN